MFTNLGFSEDFLKAVSGIPVGDVNLPEDLIQRAKVLAEEVSKIEIFEDRKHKIHEAFNALDKGYSDSVRIAFEVEVGKYIK